MNKISKGCLIYQTGATQAPFTTTTVKTATKTASTTTTTITTAFTTALTTTILKITKATTTSLGFIRFLSVYEAQSHMFLLSRVYDPSQSVL